MSRPVKKFQAPKRSFAITPGSLQDFATRALHYALAAHMAMSVHDLEDARKSADKSLLATERFLKALERRLSDEEGKAVVQ